MPVVRPEKTICVGLNYRSHIEETNKQRPEYPTLFSKFPDSLTGATSPIQLPTVSTSVDWQSRISEWLASKNFEASTPVEPVLVSGAGCARSGRGDDTFRRHAGARGPAGRARAARRRRPRGPRA